MNGFRKIGLIAGDGDLPLSIAKQAIALGDEIVVAVLEGYGDKSAYSAPCQTFGLGEIGGLLKFFKQNNCTHVTMAGKVGRPDFSKIKPDLKGIKLLPKAIKAANKGDDGLLRFLMNVFEKEGFKILAPQDICQNQLMPSGALGNIMPNENMLADMDKAMQIAALIGDADIGQGAVVCNGLVLAVEAQEGTDEMLKRIAKLPDSIRGGVLAKRLKPNQDARVDLPTIGVKTVKLASEAGIGGIVLQAGKAFVLDAEKVASLADELGLFVYGITADE